MQTSYVVLQPHSRTNPTDRYRVVNYGEWLQYVNGAIPMLPVAGSFSTMAEAVDRRDALNDGRKAR